MDKLDYLKRDNVACGELTTSEFSALYENMRVGAMGGVGRLQRRRGLFIVGMGMGWG